MLSLVQRLVKCYWFPYLPAYLTVIPDPFPLRVFSLISPRIPVVVINIRLRGNTCALIASMKKSHWHTAYGPKSCWIPLDTDLPLSVYKCCLISSSSFMLCASAQVLNFYTIFMYQACKLWTNFHVIRSNKKPLSPIQTQTHGNIRKKGQGSINISVRCCVQ